MYPLPITTGIEVLRPGTTDNGVCVSSEVSVIITTDVFRRRCTGDETVSHARIERAISAPPSGALWNLASPAGLEPACLCVRSAVLIQLSYGEMARWRR